MVIDNRAGRVLLNSEEFVRCYIESDILDESNADWLYVDDSGNTQVLYASVASAKTYLQFINTFHGIIVRLKTADDVAVIYREEFDALTVFGVRGMDR